MRRKKMLWESKRPTDTGQFDAMLALPPRIRSQPIVRKGCAVFLARAILRVLGEMSSRNGFFSVFARAKYPCLSVLG